METYLVRKYIPDWWPSPQFKFLDVFNLIYKFPYNDFNMSGYIYFTCLNIGILSYNTFYLFFIPYVTQNIRTRQQLQGYTMGELIYNERFITSWTDYKKNTYLG